MGMPKPGNVGSAELESFLAAGGRVVVFEYCVSLIALTVRRRSKAYFLRPGEKGLLRSLPYSALSLLVGWWGVPWGFIHTPLVVLSNFCGGCDITAEVRAQPQRSAGESRVPPC
ncbi:MAG TPA: hypothetical protein VKU02_05290 [Gemmataceae bacterium]|nr:hypothetical protein [Gemmataceae bacterium]